MKELIEMELIAWHKSDKCIWFDNKEYDLVASTGAHSRLNRKLCLNRGDRVKIIMQKVKP